MLVHFFQVWTASPFYVSCIHTVTRRDFLEQMPDGPLRLPEEPGASSLILKLGDEARVHKVKGQFKMPSQNITVTQFQNKRPLC